MLRRASTLPADTVETFELLFESGLEPPLLTERIRRFAIG